MSMISSLIDELRELALWLDDEFYDAEATKVRDAADTIWQLRDDLQRANAENAKLREERDYYKAMWEHATVTDCELRRVRAAWKEDREKNTKLRELLRDTYDCICEMYKYMDGGYAYEDAEADPAYGPILKRMRELGVEVKDD